MPTKVVRTDANWTGQDSEDQKCFRCVVVRLNEHVIDVDCSKQDVISSSAPESEFYAMTTGGAHGSDRAAGRIRPAHPAFVDAVVLAD